MPTLRIKRPAIVEIDANNLVDSVTNFNNALEEVSETLVERTTEIEAIGLSLLTRTHTMLHGRHGIAKSKLATSIFGRIKGAEVFEKQFMKTTQTDEIFGPMNSQKYRDEAIWEHNTEGYLPTAHLFFADEVYRASDQALPSMMGILNERVFFNGGVRQQCPLLTAIGTTNFQTESDELDAFHDRWHIHVESMPLSPGSSVRKMMRTYLDHEEDIISNTVALEEILFLQAHVRKVVFSDEMLELADLLCAKLSDNLGKLYVSDRRKCIALRFAQANAILNKREEVEADDLEMMRYGLIRVRNASHENTWTTVSGNIVGQFKSTKTERVNLRKLERFTEKLERLFDEQMTTTDATMIWKDAKRAISAIANQTAKEKPSTQDGIQRQAVVTRRLEQLLTSVKDKVSVA